MRRLFTDGWNSFWHLFFGGVSVRYNIIIPGFILYQLIDWHDKNVMCDLTEFFVGYGIVAIAYLFMFRKIQYKKSIYE